MTFLLINDTDKQVQIGRRIGTQTDEWEKIDIKMNGQTDCKAINHINGQR